MLKRFFTWFFRKTYCHKPDNRTLAEKDVFRQGASRMTTHTHYHKQVTGYMVSIPPKPVVCAGCGQPPNHTKAYAIGKETIQCPRCGRKVSRSLGNDAAVIEWNELNLAKG